MKKKLFHTQDHVKKSKMIQKGKNEKFHLIIQIGIVFK